MTQVSDAERARAIVSPIDDEATLSSTLAKPDQTAQGVPEGWQLVPIEPTEEMIGAGEDSQHSDDCTDVSRIWSAMLSTAPHPEERN